MFCCLKTYVAIRMDEKVSRNRHGKTGKLGRVNRIVGRVGLTHIFQTNFFFFKLQKQINNNLFRENE